MTKAKYTIKEVNCETGEEVIRPMTPEEEAARDLVIAEHEARIADEVAKAAAKSALLERLNITEDEAKLLLG